MANNSRNEQTLKRELGLFTGILLVAGLLIGSGVFKNIAPMAQTNLGKTALLFAWTAGGFISLIGAFTVGGLASLSDASGGTYEYLRISFGKFYSFIYGWSDFMIIGTGVNAALAILFAETVNFIIPLPNPLHSLEYITIAKGFHPFADSGIKILGILTIIILTGINCLGTRESGLINNIITSAKILGILLLIILGLNYSNQNTVMSTNITNNTISIDGWLFVSSFLTALLPALWAFDGWSYATNISGEIKNPRRNIPLALTIGILITTIIYVLLNYVFLDIIPLEKLKQLNDKDIAAILFAETIFGKYGKVLLSILIMFCVFGGLNSSILSLPRRYYQMAHEGYFFPSAKKINSRFRTPILALVYSMIWSCILLISGTFETLSNMVIFASFIFYGLLCIALFKMKRNGSIKEKVFGYPYAPIVLLFFSIIFTANYIWYETIQSVIELILIMTSIPFYFYFKNKYRKHQET